MKRGEIRWYRFKAPDKRRPVVILTRDSALEFLNEVMIAPITRTVRDIPTEVVLDVGDGMPQTCAINLDHVQTVAKGRLGTAIATLRASRMVEVREALLFAAGF